MIGELLYGLTPRDDVSLLLETRDFVVDNYVLGPGVQIDRQAFNGGVPLVPRGKLGIPIAAGVVLTGGAAEASQIRTITFDAERGSPGRSYFAGFIAGFGIAQASITLEYFLDIARDMLIRDDEIVYSNVAFNAPVSVQVNVTANLRLLFIPRGTIGV